MVDDCPMTEDCPAYDRERQMCLVHPGDCEFLPADADTALVPKTPEVRTPDTSADAMSRGRHRPERRRDSAVGRSFEVRLAFEVPRVLL